MKISLNINFRRWVYSTVIVGALPVIVRIATHLLLNVEGDWLQPEDFVFLGLTLSLTNINELNILKNNNQTKLLYQEDSVWWSTFVILFLTFILGIEYVSEYMKESLVNTTAIFVASLFFAVISLLHSGIIMYKLSRSK